MKKLLFLFSTESQQGAGGNLSSLIKRTKVSDIKLTGIASGYENGNQKLALAERIDFYTLNPEDKKEYEYIFKKNPHAHFLFWDWHLNIPKELFANYPIFFLSPGPLHEFLDIAGPSVYTKAWKLTINSRKAQIALFDMQHNGKKLWSKDINLKQGDLRRAVNAKLHHHMRSSLAEIMEKIFV